MEDTILNRPAMPWCLAIWAGMICPGRGNRSRWRFPGCINPNRGTGAENAGCVLPCGPVSSQSLVGDSLLSYYSMYNPSSIANNIKGKRHDITAFTTANAAGRSMVARLDPAHLCHKSGFDGDRCRDKYCGGQ